MMPMARRIATVNPITMTATVDPVARHPIPPHAASPVIRPAVIIGAIADLNGESDRLGRRRSDHGSCAKERGQKNNKFVFHRVFP